MKISEYLRIKESAVNSPAKLSNGKITRFFNGRWMTEAEFNELHRLPTVLNGDVNNPDKRMICLLS